MLHMPRLLVSEKTPARMGLAWHIVICILGAMPSLCSHPIYLHKANGKRVVHKLHLRYGNQCNK